MGRCDMCGNVYDKTIEIRKDGRSFEFDSFECAISVLAPTCKHCGCRVIGHGVESNGDIFCCANCARQMGVTGLVDDTANAGPGR